MNRPKLKIAVFASGYGSNFEAIAKACQSGELEAEVVLMVCDKPTARVNALADELGVERMTFSAKDYASKAEYEAEIVERCKALGGHRITNLDTRFILHQFDSQESRDSFYLEKEWGNTRRGHLTYYFGIRPLNDNCSYGKTLSLRDIAGVSLALWAMGRLGMAEEIIRFSKYDMVTEEHFVYSIRDCPTVPVKIEAWLFKVYNYILSTVYDGHPLTDDEMIVQFVAQGPDYSKSQPPDSSIIQPIDYDDLPF